MSSPIRVPDDYRIFAPLESHLYSLCAEPKPLHGALYFVDHEGKMVAFAASLESSYAEADKIREAAGKVEKPWRIAEVHAFLTHGCFPCAPLPVYFSVSRSGVFYVGDNRPKLDFTRQISSISSNPLLEQRVKEFKTELKKALNVSGSPVASDSLATRRHYPHLPHRVVE